MEDAGGGGVVIGGLVAQGVESGVGIADLGADLLLDEGQHAAEDLRVEAGAAGYRQSVIGGRNAKPIAAGDARDDAHAVEEGVVGVGGVKGEVWDIARAVGRNQGGHAGGPGLDLPGWFGEE